MLKELIKLAGELDRSGNFSEANKVDYIIKRYAQAVPDPQSPQGAGAQTISKSEARYQAQEKEGKYYISLKTAVDTFAIGSFNISEIPSVIKDIISGKRSVEGTTPGDKYTVDQFIINTYGLVNGSPKLIGRERVTESALTKSIMGSLKNLPTAPPAPPPKVLSPDEQIIEAAYQSYAGQLKGCVTLAVNADPSFGVVTKISFTVNKDGSISNCSATSVPASPEFDSCLVSKMKLWRFRELSAPTAASYNQRFGRQK